ncbi:uncharacterized protein MELLADRAFT_109905 [Melampsora larici-populina 98AG31]|uniref:CENP-V/GFA domain-containing protein n=1 Tax=Melampsora larici-populina (strain 98AG31 / pathotype 3-4-7) TaxID=747676 RepID=F4RY13_MELLP|nr:uncharacterized protein MELLADRAFT_109905 [Melampsora larici-populina 98AG31]EGG02603.1 hypothetical protein MELLADRAFT_109905 [Melampsora larici-populina 98AG31]
MSSCSLQTLNGSCFCQHVQFSIHLSNEASNTNQSDLEKKHKAASEIKPENLILSAYCHCTNCQRRNGAPFVWTTHWKHEAIKWINSTIVPFDHLESGLPNTVQVYELTPGQAFKLHCKKCGSPVGSYSIANKEWCIWGTTLERSKSDSTSTDLTSSQHTTLIKGWDLIKPTAHIFYDTRILDIRDNLGRWVGYEGDSEQLA